MCGNVSANTRPVMAFRLISVCLSVTLCFHSWNTVELWVEQLETRPTFHAILTDFSTFTHCFKLNFSLTPYIKIWRFDVSKIVISVA